MTKQTKLSRREAIKVLGAAAGASLLANIPAKWSKPELSGGFVPAHAQTSTIYSIGCEPDIYTRGPVSFPANLGGGFMATISPVQGNVVVNYSIFNGAGVTFTPSVPLGSVLTNGFGQAIVRGNFNITGAPSSSRCEFTIGNISCPQEQHIIAGAG